MFFLTIQQKFYKHIEKKNRNKEIRKMKFYAVNIRTWLWSAHSHRFVCSPTIDWPHPNVHSLKRKSVRYIHTTFFFTINKNLKTHYKKKHRGKRIWRCNVTKNQTIFQLNLVLQININLFAVQQSIDHIQMSIVWSVNQCGLSTLTFFFYHQTKIFN